MIFKNRRHAGKVLAELLVNYKNKNTIVLALPNGGIPVGLEISKILEINFDLLFVSKITPKFNSEIGYGSISESGITNLNSGLINSLNISPKDVESDIEKTKNKIFERIKSYKLKKRYDVKNKNVILVDDGIASGYTMINSIETVKRRGVGKIVIAVPTAPLSSYNKLASHVDEIICPDIKDVISFAVADAYEEWFDLSLNDAKKILIENDII